MAVLEKQARWHQISMFKRLHRLQCSEQTGKGAKVGMRKAMVEATAVIQVK